MNRFFRRQQENGRGREFLAEPNHVFDELRPSETPDQAAASMLRPKRGSVALSIDRYDRNPLPSDGPHDTKPVELATDHDRGRGCAGIVRARHKLSTQSLVLPIGNPNSGSLSLN
ncbi:hypothetical protein [Trinickia symbiotica]|uniref:hypothetical protein n=1 Tax=Trinickia symbiotica TaxID=863227 RepID=UPI002158A34C|nr:hypothetical protein [Trinickia symbiotica]